MVMSRFKAGDAVRVIDHEVSSLPEYFEGCAATILPVAAYGSPSFHGRMEVYTKKGPLKVWYRDDGVQLAEGPW